MAMHKTNSLLKYVAIPTLIMVFLFVILAVSRHQTPSTPKIDEIVKNTASNDSAAESLDTLTADLSKTKQKIAEVSKDNELLKQQSSELLNQLNIKKGQEISNLSEEMTVLKNQFQNLTQKTTITETTNGSTISTAKPISLVEDLGQPSVDRTVLNLMNTNKLGIQNSEDNNKPSKIPMRFMSHPPMKKKIMSKLLLILLKKFISITTPKGGN